MSAADPASLYRAAYRTAQLTDRRMSGYYNNNVRVDAPGGPVLVRIPVPRADQMDLRGWAEPDVLLNELAPRGAGCPCR